MELELALINAGFLDEHGGDLFNSPLSPMAIFVIMMGGVTGALVLCLVAFMLHKV